MGTFFCRKVTLRNGCGFEREANITPSVQTKSQYLPPPPTWVQSTLSVFVGRLQFLSYTLGMIFIWNSLHRAQATKFITNPTQITSFKDKKIQTGSQNWCINSWSVTFHDKQIKISNDTNHTAFYIVFKGSWIKYESVYQIHIMSFFVSVFSSNVDWRWHIKGARLIASNFFSYFLRFWY